MNKEAQAQLYRDKLAAMLAARPDINATMLSRELGRDKGFINDFLSGRKKTMNAADWQTIEARLSEPAAQEPDPADVQLLGVVLSRLLQDESRAQTVLQGLLEGLKTPR
jgi:hypothetical protein